ncbi:ubiquinol--cytochrome-c reductase subunit 8 [Penicillium taxi]|uniref:ubiquinol--cytochrome-c reductase subunit 8 n=1 Tax=Penicillium taxi TaxID=168475 RepID=UPI00254539DE|nr:ubiquinol--cytochrome-c reductase subunit 8 [Penicillium taxi]KAJ5901903.1 ubiquinol--cytochrome-c reductase subunit 8 [Penicillium taxi]
MGGHSVDPKNGSFIGNWGEFDPLRNETSAGRAQAITTIYHLETDIQPAGCPTPQRIATYSLSSNRQRPFAGAFHAAIFNTFRRTAAQALYVAPPFVAAYLAMEWAVERNHFLNSKPGRALTAAEGTEE